MLIKHVVYEGKMLTSLFTWSHSTFTIPLRMDTIFNQPHFIKEETKPCQGLSACLDLHGK